MKKIIRVFPRKTNATPDDDLARFDKPTKYDEADEVRVSVSWTWDKPKAEMLAEQWRKAAPRVLIGGPAYDDPGGEFVPGRYVKNGYVITSRGCPNRCWFCMVPKREGEIRELKIHEGFNILDSNLLACSPRHIKAVFAMLARQKEKPRFTGGLEAKRMTPEIAHALRLLKPASAYFAYDTPDDYEPLREAWRMLQNEGETNSSRAWSCFVLIGYKNDTFEKAEKRLQSVLHLGLMPMAMLFNRGVGKSNEKDWKKFQREWANKILVGLKMTAYRKGSIK